MLLKDKKQPISDCDIKQLKQEKVAQDQLIAALQKDIKHYQEIIQQKEEASQKNEALATHYKDKYEQVIQAFLDAQRHRFGKKSEKVVDIEGYQQLALFETPSAPPAVTDSKEEDVEIICYERSKHKKDRNNQTIPVREEIITVNQDDRVCPCCGKEKVCMRYEEKKLLNYQPAIFEIIHQKREVLACKKGCEGAVVTAENPPHILPKCSATASLLAYICVSKVLDRQPLYHLEKRLVREHGWHIQRKTMARWMIQLAEKCQPLITLMKEELMGYPIVSIDATTLQVLQEPGRCPETKSYVYCIRGGPPDKQITLFEYNAYSQKNYIKELFGDFEYKGYIQSDAAPVYADLLDHEDYTWVFCHAHARRYFERIYRATKKKCPKEVKQALLFYKALYTIEAEAKKAQLSPQDVYAYRQKHSKPLLEAHKKWLDDLSQHVLPKRPLGKAVHYSIRHWKELNHFLCDGRLSIDNNETEGQIRPFVTARKNFLFSATQAGADSLGVHFGLISTAKHHGHNPYTYYETLFKKIPLYHSFEDYRQLLPWNVPPRLSNTP